MQVYKYKSIKYANMQVCKYASTQVCKYKSMQVQKYKSYALIANDTTRNILETPLKHS